MDELFPGVYYIDNRIATKNLAVGKKVYNERLVKVKGTEYRMWDPFRSKLAAALRKGLKTFPFVSGSKVLYLGASTGTTISHLSDILGKKGEIYSVEVSPQCMQSLLRLSESRDNVIPILGDARKPDEYKEVGEVEAIYQDVAQPDQSDILIKNAKKFLKNSGIAMLAIKSQSIDAIKSPKDVFGRVLKELSTDFVILEQYRLEPFDKDHLFVVLKKK